jgi:hypothetical protein
MADSKIPNFERSAANRKSWFLIKQSCIRVLLLGSLGLGAAVCWGQEDSPAAPAVDPSASTDSVPTSDGSQGSQGSQTKSAASQLRRPTAPTDATKLADRPPKPKFLRSEEQAKPEKYDLTFDDLAFEIEAGQEFRWSMISAEIHQYDGAKVTLRGYIRPSFSQRGLKQFVFVRDNQECCFGPGAALFDCVLVKMAEGKEASFTVRPVTIEGEFYLRKYAGLDGNVWAIYRIKDAQVK